MQKKKEDKYFMGLLQIHNYLVSLPTNPERKVTKITFKNNTFTS